MALPSTRYDVSRISQNEVATGLDLLFVELTSRVLRWSFLEVLPKVPLTPPPPQAYLPLLQGCGLGRTDQLVSEVAG